ncbi:hypothetical protein F5B22DRAFT_297142 [Xylaria bambusicola]|uniref:uncharacterized protein n=1 Tax=Xylaria bambusicola TaxID=326684 RepID=UPI002007A8F5|nr:uncharacterized protein F5B22DRAFT_297142 [Xylaria bambusicola]KAI0512831.1 hypothetical protein F5B22DRAFT_297142 [Xylaria bambusicola]
MGMNDSPSENFHLIGSIALFSLVYKQIESRIFHMFGLIVMCFTRFVLTYSDSLGLLSRRVENSWLQASTASSQSSQLLGSGILPSYCPSLVLDRIGCKKAAFKPRKPHPFFLSSCAFVCNIYS